jgi:hypothetical protein
MNFIERISNYVLGNLTTKDLPKIGEIALLENLESESIFILAGMNKNDNSFQILEYFNKSLKELNINPPNKIEASKILIKYYLNQIIQNPNNAYEIMMKIDNEIYKNINFETSQKKYVGEELNLEHLYTWYREIQDWNDNGMLLYYNELNRTEQRQKFGENLVEEAKNALKNNYS